MVGALPEGTTCSNETGYGVQAQDHRHPSFEIIKYDECDT